MLYSAVRDKGWNPTSSRVQPGAPTSSGTHPIYRVPSVLIPLLLCGGGRDG